MTVTKLWIGDDKELRKLVLGLIDVNKYGGAIYFRNCSEIYFYKKKEGFDIRVSENRTCEYFKKHKGKEIFINK